MSVQEPPLVSAPPGYVEVEKFSIYQDSGGACCYVLECWDGRSFPLWLTEEDYGKVAAIRYREQKPQFPIAAPPPEADRADDLLYTLVHSRSANWFACRAIYRTSPQEEELQDGLLGAMILTLYTEAPLYVAGELLADFPAIPFPPGNWLVGLDLLAEGELRLTTAPRAGEERFFYLTVAGGILAFCVWAAFYKAQLAFVLGGLFLVMLLEPFLWWLCGRESWRLAPNALEFRRLFLGLSWGRRVVGGTLIVTRARTPRGDWNGLLVEERGRRRLLTPNVNTDYAWALGQFVSAYTGWPLLREE